MLQYMNYHLEMPWPQYSLNDWYCETQISHVDKYSYILEDNFVLSFT